jgi:hypothetical protein
VYHKGAREFYLEVDVPQLTINLKSFEKTALRILANQERRDVRSQAALIIRRELEQQGLLDQTSRPRATDQQGVEIETD